MHILLRLNAYYYEIYGYKCIINLILGIFNYT